MINYRIGLLVPVAAMLYAGSDLARVSFGATGSFHQTVMDLQPGTLSDVEPTSEFKLPAPLTTAEDKVK